ncbi:MAG: hypothetical protein HYU67_07515 [Flavobacteriia bacterium]|nr:hypothetical protein [Flavobacteriia bacterium]
MKTNRKSVQRKIEWTLNLIQTSQKVPEKYIKHLEGTKDSKKFELKLVEIYTEYKTVARQYSY